MASNGDILVVDDTPASLQLVSGLLIAEGYSVRPADGGELALASAAANPPELILLDIRMPGLGGFEVFARLKADAATAEVPVIFLTAATEPEERIAGLKLGAVDYIVKPFNREELLAKVHTHTKLFRLTKRLETQTRELAEERDRLSTLLSSISDEVWFCDINRKFTLVNPVGSKNLNLQSGAGADVEKLAGSLDVLRADGTPRPLSEAPPLMALEGKPVDKQEEIIRLPVSGERRWRQVSSNPVHNPTGAIIGSVSVVRDITDQKKARQEMDRQSGTLKSLVDNLPLGVFMVEAPSGKPMFANAAALKILGRGILPDASRQNLADSYAAYKMPGRTPYPPEEMPILRGMNGETSHISDMLVVRPDGSESFLEIFGSAVRNSKGEVLASLASFVDITARIETEAALLISQNLLKETEKIGKVGGWSFNIDTLKQVWTEEVYRIHEVEIGPNPSVEKGINYYTPESRPIIERAVQRAIEHGEGFDLRLEIITAKNNRRWVHTIGRADLANRRIYGFFQDITERRQMDEERLAMQLQLQQSQKMESVGRLAGGVAHDFNNLLTAIGGYAGFLMRGLPKDDPKQEDVKEIIAATERAAGLTKQLLAFSRKQILNPQVLDLNASVAGVAKMLKRLIGEHIQLQTKCAAKACLVKLDQGQIDQVLINLGINSRDAMPKGGVLALETEIVTPDERFCLRYPRLAQGPLVCLTVRDTGCGLTAEAKEHLFEPFFTTKEQGKGTGLGLSTVFGIIKQSGGEIEAESELNSGTTFRLYFQHIGAKVSTKDNSKSNDKDKDTLLRGSETILLVEDEDTLRRLAERLLKTSGYSVIAAADGKSALEAAERCGKPFDLLLTDVVMPGMNGRELAKEMAVRKLAHKTLFMSGYTDDAISEHGVLESGIAFIYKPFTVEALSQKLREVLDGPADKARA